MNTTTNIITLALSDSDYERLQAELYRRKLTLNEFAIIAFNSYFGTTEHVATYDPQA